MGTHAFPFLLNIQQISNFREVDKQIIIDIDLDCGVKGILDVQHISLKVFPFWLFMRFGVVSSSVLVLFDMSIIFQKSLDTIRDNINCDTKP